jgi:XisI protein
MDKALKYAEILTRVLREESKQQPSLQPIRIASVCDVEAGEYLLIATGWENKHRLDTILFHAHLTRNRIVIESDYTEDGLKPALLEAGIEEPDIISKQSRREFEQEIKESVAA